MTIDSYQPSDAKKTVEKLVKQKPSKKELVIIEKPGKPMPASRLEDKQKATKKKKPKTKSKPTAKAKEITKKDCILIITEKPQAANKIASALASPKTPNKYSENKVPFYELTHDNEKIIVASAVGHLFNLTYQKGQTGWPIFKTEWIPSYSIRKSAYFTKNYYNLIKKLVKRAKEIIIATDYDIEGEVIGWNVLRFIAKKENAKRMKYSTLTKPELIKSYEKTMPELAWGQAYAGETRHLTDWLYGINLSRALMSAIKTTGSFRILSIGRVQGPTLKIIVERDKEIQKFKPQPFWQVLAHANKIQFKHPKDIFDKKELEDFKKIKEAIAETTKKEETITPLPPFDLTTLQRESYKFFKLSPSNTLKVAQSLYLEGIISYPRTSSQKIPKEINPKSILKKLGKRFPKAKNTTRQTPIEGKKTDPAHPSIYPTGEFSSKELQEDEQKLYNLIVKRFISCFYADAKTANHKVKLTPTQEELKTKKFTATGLTVLKKGWTEVYPTKFEERELPDINGKVKIDKLEFPEKETQPPKRYTAASLVSLLEKKSLGTKATRSIIVDTLFDRGYLDGKSIQATPLGIKLIEALEKYSPIIIDENLTKEVDEQMEEILSSKKGFETKEKKIIKTVEKVINDISKDFKANELKIGKELLEGTQELHKLQKENSTIMDCPVCKKGKLTIKYSKKTRKYFAACDKYPDCKTTYSLPPNSLIKKTDKVNEDGLPILMAIRKGKRPWEFPFDPYWREKQEKQETKEKKEAEKEKDSEESK